MTLMRSRYRELHGDQKTKEVQDNWCETGIRVDFLPALANRSAL